MKRKSYHSSNAKVQLFRENIVVIEEEWFDGMNLTDGTTFPKVLIKRENQNSIKTLIYHVTQSNTYMKLQ